MSGGDASDPDGAAFFDAELTTAVHATHLTDGDIGLLGSSSGTVDTCSATSAGCWSRLSAPGGRTDEWENV